MNITKKIYLSLFFVCSILPSLAYADKLLDKVEVIQTQSESQIHIEFTTQVLYLRHSPTVETSRVQIFLDFPQIPQSAISIQREFRNTPSTGQIPSFTVNYPEQQPGSIGVRFKKPIKFTVTTDNSGRGIVIHVPVDKSAVTVTAQVAAPIEPAVEHGPQGEVPAKPEGMSDNDYAGKLMAEARVARGTGDYPKAVQWYNAVLALPANAHSQDAQELIGNSREKMGEHQKAQAEYEAYLKLYPTGEGAERVRQRLAIIVGATKVVGADKKTALGKKPIREIHENTVFGSWNQYYYDAHSHNYNPNPSTNRTTHDQSSLISSLDLTARFRQNEWDSKIVYRNTQTMNFLPRGEDRDRTSAAYVEVENKDVDFMTRLGRQNGNSGGVLGRFDGALFRYGFTPKNRLNFVAGTLDEYKVDYRRHFYGINLDFGINDNWSGNGYFIEQRVDSLLDRRAVGGELRYFNGGKSIYSLVDYDTYYDRLNTVMVQGNWLTTDGTNYNMLAEHRKSPVLQLINGLQHPFLTSNSIYPLLNTPVLNPNQAIAGGVTESDLRKFAIDQTIDTSLVLFGATRQFTPRWQLGADVQMSRVSGSAAAADAAYQLARKNFMDANGGIEPDPITDQSLHQSFTGGNTYTYHIQAVGTDTLFKDDTSVISASLTTGPTSLVQSLIFTNVMVPRDKWRLDSSIKVLKIDTDPSTVQYVIGPTMRASYRLREKATIEGEVGFEVTNDNTAGTGHTRTFRDFSFIGYRLDI